MPRKPRIHYHGALYHVMCRGNNGEQIFEADKYKSLYLRLLEKYKERYGYQLYAYCIMDNHVHLLMEVGDSPLSQIMQGIQQTYTQIFNKANNRTGHVFQQRYKALLCNKDQYLLTLIRYIHQNPLKAHLKDGLNYRWSSHSLYRKYAKNSIVNIDFPMKLFAENIEEATKAYIRFMNEEVEEKEELNWGDGNDTCKQKLQNKTSIILSHETIIQIVEETTHLSITELHKGYRIQSHADARKLLIQLLDRYTGATKKEISQWLHVSQAFVSKVLTGHYSQTEVINKMMGEIENKLISQA